MRQFDGLIRSVENNLRTSGFKCLRNVALPNGVQSNLVASRFECLLGSVSLLQYLLLEYAPRATDANFDALFEGGFQYAKHAGNDLSPPGKIAILTVPCLVVEAADTDLVTYVSGKPHQRWFRFKFPILHDLFDDSTYYYKYGKTPMHGSMLYPITRTLAESLFSNSQIPRYYAEA